MWKIFCAFLLAFLMAETQASPGDYCDTNNDCDSGECCQNFAEYPIVSRKRQGSGENGTCQRYKSAYQRCLPTDEYNGYCGCEAGTRCTYHPPPPTTYPPTPEVPQTPPPTTPPYVHVHTSPLYPAPSKKRYIPEGAFFDCQPI